MKPDKLEERATVHIDYTGFLFKLFWINFLKTTTGLILQKTYALKLYFLIVLLENIVLLKLFSISVCEICFQTKWEIWFYCIWKSKINLHYPYKWHSTGGLVSVLFHFFFKMSIDYFAYSYVQPLYASSVCHSRAKKLVLIAIL